MKKAKTAVSIIWFSFVSLLSPFWIGCIYMYITGHGKGYGYDMGADADIAVFLGVILLLLWLLAILPVTVSLCKKCCSRKKTFLLLPLLAFAGFFAIGVFIMGWNEFIKLFGYGYVRRFPLKTEMSREAILRLPRRYSFPVFCLVSFLCAEA